ncbi:MAG: DUF3006 domain-containing protein, partial [Betaproteobacteria bacterium]
DAPDFGEARRAWGAAPECNTGDSARRVRFLEPAITMAIYIDRGREGCTMKAVEIRVTLDRIEDGKAVLLVRESEADVIIWPVRALPEGVREGMILKVRIELDEEATQAAKERVEDLIKKLVSKGR